MYKQEIPLMYPSENAVLQVKSAMFDPFEYFALRQKDGLLKTDFKVPLGKVSYHIPCHSRVQNVGQKTREILQLVPDTEVNTVERCSGHDGTWGVKKEYYEISMKIGKPVFRSMAKVGEQAPDYVSSDCAIAARHIMQGIDETQSAVPGVADIKKRHPLELLCVAYGI
jgi:Fe-S oxidoreductase